MGKSYNRKWYDKFDNDYDDNYVRKNKKDHRRKQKKIKNALKEKNLSYFDQEEDQH